MRAVSPSLVDKLYFAGKSLRTDKQCGPQGRPKTWKIPVKQGEFPGASVSVDDASGRTLA